MAAKPIVHAYEEGTTIPFDVSLYRAVKFSRRHPDDLMKARAALRFAIDEALKPDHRIDNPVTRTRGVVAAREEATPTEQLILRRLQDLENRSKETVFTKRGTTEMVFDFAALTASDRKGINNIISVIRNQPGIMIIPTGKNNEMRLIIDQDVAPSTIIDDVEKMANLPGVVMTRGLFNR